MTTTDLAQRIMEESEMSEQRDLAIANIEASLNNFTIYQNLDQQQKEAIRSAISEGLLDEYFEHDQSAEIERLKAQDEVHWKTRRTLLKNIEALTAELKNLPTCDISDNAVANRESGIWVSWFVIQEIIKRFEAEVLPDFTATSELAEAREEVKRLTLENSVLSENRIKVHDSYECCNANKEEIERLTSRLRLADEIVKAYDNGAFAIELSEAIEAYRKGE